MTFEHRYPEDADYERLEIVEITSDGSWDPRKFTDDNPFNRDASGIPRILRQIEAMNITTKPSLCDVTSNGKNCTSETDVFTRIKGNVDGNGTNNEDTRTIHTSDAGIPNNKSTCDDDDDDDDESFDSLPHMISCIPNDGESNVSDTAS